MRNLTLRDPSFLGASLLSVSNSPLFNMPFSVNRTLTDTVSGGSLITFSRAAATGTFIDLSGVLQTAAADAARFTTDPLTLVSLGLLVEEQRTNLLLRSEEFNDTFSWARSAGVSITPNAEVAPNGTLTADFIEFGASDRQLTQSAVFASGVQYSGSVYIKGTAGEIIRFGGSSLGASNLTLTGSWQRIVFTYTATGTSGTLGISTFLGATARNIYLWGAQLEAGAFPTNYILTTSAVATRNADAADITSANSALIGAIRTLFVEFRSPAVGTRGVISLNDGTANNRIEVRTSGTAVQVLIVIGGITVTITAGTITANARARLVVRIGAASSSASLNGAAPVTAAATRPTVDRVAIARSQANEYLNGTIATLTAWGQEFTDSMLVIQST